MEKNPTKEDEVMSPLKDEKTEKIDIKPYKRRWIIMGIFIYYASLNSFQWLEYSSITNLVVKYYHVSTMSVDWTSTVYMAVYPLLVIPVSYLIDRKGLRWAALIGCSGNFVATIIKLFSIQTDRFWVILFGQLFAAISQLFIVCLPPKIASVWFKENEVSTACSLGVFGTQLGYAFGFIIPSNIVHDSDNIDEIGERLKILSWILVGAMIPVTIAVYTFFPSQPKRAPNKAQYILRKNKTAFDNSEFWRSIKQLISNKAFLINVIAYSLNIGGFNSVAILLNQLLLQYFPGAEEDVGWMGFLLIIVGMIGSLAFGLLLDKTHKYKEISLFIYTSSILSLICMMFTMKYHLKIMTYITSSLMGLFANAYMPVGFEFTMELTYPSEESTTIGIVMCCVQFVGVFTTISLGYLNQILDGFWSLAIGCGLLTVGNIVMFMVPNKLLRQEAFKLSKMEFRRNSSFI